MDERRRELESDKLTKCRSGSRRIRIEEVSELVIMRKVNGLVLMTLQLEQGDRKLEIIKVSRFRDGGEKK